MVFSLRWGKGVRKKETYNNTNAMLYAWKYKTVRTKEKVWEKFPIE